MIVPNNNQYLKLSFALTRAHPRAVKQGCAKCRRLRHHSVGPTAGRSPGEKIKIKKQGEVSVQCARFLVFQKIVFLGGWESVILFSWIRIHPIKKIMFPMYTRDDINAAWSIMLPV